jgi:hypothetical protein
LGDFIILLIPSAHGRVQLLNSKPAVLMVHARKVAPFPEKLQPIQQSDYVTLWTEKPSKQAAAQDGPVKAFIRAHFSTAAVARISKGLRYLRHKREGRRWRERARLSNRKLYVPVKQWDVTTDQAFNQ